MSSRTWSLLRSRFGRNALVGAACFTLGSVTLVYAGAGGPISNGNIQAIGDALDNSLTARVNASGELSTVDRGAGTRLDEVNTRLARFSYDADGNLKTAAQGESQVNGHVSVDNLPATQQVAGTVSVGHLPSTQQVAGAVSIDNLPAVQSVAGTVAVSNLPANQVVTVSNQPVTQNVSGMVAVSNLPANQTVTVSNLPGNQVVSGTVNVGNFPATQDVHITGGNIAAAQPVTDCNAGFFAAGPQPLDGLHPINDAFGETLNITTMSLSGTGLMHIQCSRGPGAFEVVFFFTNNFIQTFPSPLALDRCVIGCDSGNCTVAVSILGYRP